MVAAITEATNPENAPDESGERSRRIRRTLPTDRVISRRLLTFIAPAASGEMRKWVHAGGIICMLVHVAWGGIFTISTSLSGMPGGLPLLPTGDVRPS
jgi:hypothetical protein